MPTLVTGGTGYVGGAIVRALRARGEPVRVLARANRPTDHLARLGVEIARGDILDRASVDAALKGCERLYHAAAIYAFWVPDRPHLIRTEVDGTRNVMAAAEHAGVLKTVYTSTTFTIGEAKGELGNETTRHRGHFYAAYEEAKYRAEQVVLEYVQKGLPVVIVNPAGVYGPGGVGATGESIVAALNGKLPMSLHGVISLVYVDDAVSGHLLAADTGRVGDRYILSGVRIDATELLRTACRLAGVTAPPVGPLFVGRLAAVVEEVVARITGRPPQVARDTVAMLAHGSQLDGSKAERELGLRYTPLEEGLSRAIAWYWEQGLLRRKPACLSAT